MAQTIYATQPGQGANVTAERKEYSVTAQLSRLSDLNDRAESVHNALRDLINQLVGVSDAPRDDRAINGASAPTPIIPPLVDLYNQQHRLEEQLAKMRVQVQRLQELV